MGLITSQQIAQFYDLYKDKEVTFNRQTIDVLALLPREVFLKIRGDQVSCIVYAASMTGAKILANLQTNTMQLIRQAGNSVSLRFAFQRADKPEPLFFYVPAKVANYSFYNAEKPDLYLLTLEYSTRPPDDLIEILGQVFDTYTNFKRRKDERIELNPTNIKLIGMDSKEAALVLDKQARKCIIRDLSFSGTKVLLFAAKADHVQKTAYLQFSAQKQRLLVPGTVIRFEEVVGRSDIGAYGIEFLEEQIPMAYKLLINNTLRAIRHSHE